MSNKYRNAHHKRVFPGNYGLQYEPSMLRSLGRSKVYEGTRPFTCILRYLPSRNVLASICNGQCTTPWCLSDKGQITDTDDPLGPKRQFVKT